MNVNGWALSGPRSTRLHAVPMPTDLGDHGRAVCGKRPSLRGGWLERDEPTAPKRCTDCTKQVAAA